MSISKYYIWPIFKLKRNLLTMKRILRKS